MTEPEVRQALAAQWQQQGVPDPVELARREAIMRRRWDWDEWDEAMPLQVALVLLRERLAEERR